VSLERQELADRRPRQLGVATARSDRRDGICFERERPRIETKRSG
jgi:hypothetical protein